MQRLRRHRCEQSGKMEMREVKLKLNAKKQTFKIEQEVNKTCEIVKLETKEVQN